MKTLLPQSDVWCIDNYLEVMRKKSKSNEAISVENQDFHDWTSYLSQYYKKIDRIQKYHMFQFDKKQKGIVPSEDWTRINILRKKQVVTHLEPKVEPRKGMNVENQQTMYLVICQYVLDR